MRILLASETFLPRVSGVTTHIDHLAAGLLAKGHTVAVIAPSDNHKAYTEKFHGYEVFRIPSVKSPWQRHTRVAIQSYPLVVDAVKTFKPDIAHLHTPLGVPSSVLACARWQHFPVVATHHFSIEFVVRYLKPLALLKPVTQRAIIGYLNRVYKKCNLLLTPTYSMKSVLTHCGIKAPVTVVSNGILVNQIESGSWPRKRQLVYVGRLAAEKNLELLVEVINRVFQLDKKVSLLICGDGTRRAFLETEFAHWGNRVTFAGILEPDSANLAKAYSQSVAALSTSLVEAQGLTVLEAMSYSTPVVAAEGGAIAEVVIDKENGMLIKRGDTEAYVQAILYLLEHPKEAEKMGKVGREFVKQHHSFEATVNQLESVYESVRAHYSISK